MAKKIKSLTKGVYFIINMAGVKTTPQYFKFLERFMIFFLIKKTFFDMWDNLFRILILNVAFIALFFLFFFSANLLKDNTGLSYVILFAGLAVFTIYCGGVSLFVKEIADYKKPGILDFFSYVKKSWLTSIFIYVVLVVFIILSNVSFSYYSSLNNIFGYIVFCILTWVSVFFILSIQYYFPIYGSMNNKPLKTLKKCFLVFIDNPLFTIILLIGSMVIMALSILALLLIPGIAGLLLWLNAGTKLRLYKYDYLEAHPEARGKKIPWKELMVNDIECIGKRTLKNLIFPWKE